MAEEDKKLTQLSEQMAANSGKSGLVEKLVFAGIPILFSCVVYLMSSLSDSKNEIISLKSKIAIVVNSDNKAIPPQGTTIDMAQIRESLSDQIGKVERDSALARAAMTLDREKSLAMNQKTALDMTADAANARAAIRMEVQKLFGELDKKIAILEFRLNNK
jgi:hypothetical protein